MLRQFWEKRRAVTPFKSRYNLLSFRKKRKGWRERSSKAVFKQYLYFSAVNRSHLHCSSSSFLICCTLKATEELGGAALQEGSTGPQRKSLALLLNSPVSAALSCVSGYRLLPPASSCNFSVVEKHDSVFSESTGAISRQCRGRQCLRNSNSFGI